MTPTIFLTYFDPTRTGRFEPILRTWFERYKQSGCTLPVWLLSDLLTVPPDMPFAGKVVVGPSAFSDVMRTGNAFDYKSALICAALPLLPPGAVIMDVDAVFVKDPTTYFAALADEPFAMPPDSGRRRIPWKGSHGESIPEHSSSVMIFGDDSAGMREALVDNYRKAWEWLAQHDDARGIIDAIREQRAWSLVHFWSDACLMDERLNWSPYHYQDNPEAIILHHHGAKKFTDLTPQ